MRADVRRKLEMVEGVRAFNASHPTEDASHALVVAKFEEKFKRAETLATQERAGRIASKAASKRRRDLRRGMQSELLHHLLKVGELAGKERPDLAAKFQVTSRGAAHQVFMTAARAILTDAQEVRDVLVQNGMAATMFDELAKAVDEFEAASNAVRNGRADHVGAAAELKVVAGELVDLVVLLNGINRFRFRDNPELLAAWDSARNVVGPMKGKAEPGSATPPAAGEGLPKAA